MMHVVLHGTALIMTHFMSFCTNNEWEERIKTQDEKITLRIKGKGRKKESNKHTWTLPVRFLRLIRCFLFLSLSFLVFSPFSVHYFSTCGLEDKREGKRLLAADTLMEADAVGGGVIRPISLSA